MISKVTDTARSLSKAGWVSFYLGVIFNLFFTGLLLLLCLPFEGQLLITAKTDGGFTSPSSLMIGAFYNNPWAFILVVPASILGLLIPLFRNIKFLTIYRVVLILTAWNQFSMGLITILADIRFALLNTAVNHTIWPTLYVSLIAGVVFIVQAIGMSINSFFVDKEYHHILQNEYDPNGAEVIQNKGYKGSAVAIHISAAIINLFWVFYCSLYLYAEIKEVLATPGKNFDVGSMVVFSFFSLFSIVFIVLDVVSAILFIVVLTRQNTEKTIPLISSILDFVQAVVSLGSFSIVGFSLLIYFALGAAGKVANFQVLDFYEAFFALGAIGVLKIIEGFSGIKVMISNRKVTGFGVVDTLRRPIISDPGNRFSNKSAPLSSEVVDGADVGNTAEDDQYKSSSQFTYKNTGNQNNTTSNYEESDDLTI